MRQNLSDHNCAERGCRSFVSLFDLEADKKLEYVKRERERKAAFREAVRAAKLTKAARSKCSEALRRKRKIIKERNTANKVNKESPPPVFPPPAPSKELRHKIIRGMCEDMDPEKIEESGCAVCGQLTPNIELTPRDELDLDWDLLCRPGVTRKERFHNDDPVEELEGPILLDNCNSVCADCEARMRSRVLPLFSLANHIWIGQVPWQLQDLSFAEKMLIAKVRHNRCVIRVASGRGKMSANAIMFSSPVVKVYHILPPSKDDISEVMAFIFVGPARPTDQEYVRTPMLVRREKVRHALEWLKLNHEDYAQLEISSENLADLPESGIPCGVDWKQTDPDESNNVAAAMSVHESSEEHGTGEGACSFSTLKAKAMEHLKRGGDVLGVGQSEEPETLYHNVQLYPQMFPWLFPYGKGGIGNPVHKNRMSELRHKKQLLMYHDKRFQTDLYFPMIAFNDAQIKGGSSGSHLLAKTQNFKSVAERLRRVDTAVLSDLASRLERGEHIQTKTEAEKLCFDLLNDLEH
ncbi:hypothetical protein C8R43DRAFT_909503, partial [Mycena crocata]